MIHEVDSALRTLIEREAAGMRDVEIVFDAPTREWAGRRNSPTIDVYLYDIREDLRRRERGMHNVYDESNTVVSRRLPPRHFKLSYLVTAWTQRPEDEHRLLSSLLLCFLKYDALPSDVLTGPLTELGCRSRSRSPCHPRRTGPSPTSGRRWVVSSSRRSTWW